MSENATAAVELYGGGSSAERASVRVTFGDGTMVLVSLPFSRTAPGETPEVKYSRVFGKVLDGLAKGAVLPDGQHGWKVPYEGGEALIGDEKCAGYSIGSDRLDLEPLKRALEQLRDDPGRIKVAPFYKAEGKRSYEREI